MSTMLHNKRAVRQCSMGCCKVYVRNSLLRRRETASWRIEYVRGGFDVE